MKTEEILQLKLKYNYEVTGISIDSRTIRRNDIFVCIKGYNYNGNDYIEDVLDKKVRTIITNDENIYNKYLNHKINMILVEDSVKELAQICKIFYRSYINKISLIGITGTNGKTTVSTLLYKYYRFLGKNIALIGTNGIYINDDYIETNNTTPNILTIYNVIKRAVEKEC